MQRAWLYAGTAFAILFALWAHQSWHLSLTDALGPGPGFFPFWLSVIGGLLCVALIAQVHRNRSDEHAASDADRVEPWPRGHALREIVIALATLTAVTALLETLGFQIVMAAFCLIVLPALGARNWWVIIAFAALAGFGVYAVFSDVLKVPLPAGLLEP